MCESGEFLAGHTEIQHRSVRPMRVQTECLHTGTLSALDSQEYTAPTNPKVRMTEFRFYKYALNNLPPKFLACIY